MIVTCHTEDCENREQPTDLGQIEPTVLEDGTVVPLVIVCYACAQPMTEQEQQPEPRPEQHDDTAV